MKKRKENKKTKTIQFENLFVVEQEYIIIIIKERTKNKTNVKMISVAQKHIHKQIGKTKEIIYE